MIYYLISNSFQITKKYLLELSTVILQLLYIKLWAAAPHDPRPYQWDGIRLTPDAALGTCLKENA